MRRDKWITLLSALLLSFLLSFSGSACIASGFGLEVDLIQLALCCVLISLLSCTCCHFRLGYLIPFLLFGIGIILYYYFELEASLKVVLNCISMRYNKGYGWKVLSWSDLQYTDATTVLAYISSYVCALTAWSTCRNRSSAFPITAGILMLVPCTMVLSTVPENHWLFLWLTAIILLLLTDLARKQQSTDASRLAFLFVIPVALFLLAIFHLAPRDEYQRDKLADRLLEKLEQLIGNDELNYLVDLESTGRQRASVVPVLDVWVTETDCYYLRGYAYDTYDGTQWSDSGEICMLPWAFNSEYKATVTVKTRIVEPLLYLPYDLELLRSQKVSAGLSNTDKSTTYTYDDSYSGLSIPYDYAANPESLKRMLALPDETAAWAKDFLEEYHISTVDEIADFVRQSARYDLDTPMMSENYDDFAQWFLESSESGYCVHFATAATVLLRAAGIPARYVTGFMAEANASEWTTVRRRDAHAWVEWFSEEKGWQILDPTPAEEIENVEVSTQASETMMNPETTEAVETTTEKQEPTEPVQSSTQKTDKPENDVPVKETVETIELSPPEYSYLWVICTLVVIILILLQWRLRVYLRRRRRSIGTNNMRAVEFWKQIDYCCSVLPEEPEKKVYQLAQKAKFSTHVLTREEMQLFERYLQQCIKKLRRAPWYRRLYYRLILALY